MPEAAHPARFPVAFAREFVEPFTVVGDTVLDPFCGAGTTGVACAKLGRAFIGVEINEAYFDIACQRVRDACAQPDFFHESTPKAEQLTMLTEATP